MKHNIDDVGCTRALLDDLVPAVAVDPARAYATGISNGEIMSYRLAAELSDYIAAIVPVAGPMGTRTCNPKHPVAVMPFHGAADDSAPLKGGMARNPAAAGAPPTSTR